MPAIEFIIIGAQKAGTTFVQQSLRNHPQVYLPRYETNTFEAPHYTEQAATALLESLAAKSRAAKTGIKRPDYLAHAECSRNIARHLPDARLVVILRDPVERLRSAYYHYMKYSDVPIREINSGLSRLIGGEYQSEFPRSAELVEFGFYHKHLLRYLDRFPEENLFIRLYDDIQNEQTRFLSELCEFLAIDAKQLRPYQSRRRGAAIYSLRRLRFLNLMYRFWFRLEPGAYYKIYHKDPLYLRKAVVHAANVVDRTVLSRLFPAGQPTLNKELVERIGRIYIEDTERLQGVIGRDLSHWQVFRYRQPVPA